MLILALTGVASINGNGRTLHSTFGLPSRKKHFSLDRNILAASRNKYTEAELIILDEISIVSKKKFLSNTSSSHRNF